MAKNVCLGLYSKRNKRSGFSNRYIFLIFDILFNLLYCLY